MIQFGFGPKNSDKGEKETVSESKEQTSEKKFCTAMLKAEEGRTSFMFLQKAMVVW